MVKAKIPILKKLIFITSFFKVHRINKCGSPRNKALSTNLRKREGLKNKKYDYFGYRAFQNNRI